MSNLCGYCTVNRHFSALIGVLLLPDRSAVNIYQNKWLRLLRFGRPYKSNDEAWRTHI